MIDWKLQFRSARDRGCGVAVQNVSPSPSQGSRNIYEDDEKEILAAASEFGFVKVEGPRKIISFV